MRTQESCWIRGDLSGDPVFFMDNADAQPDSDGAGAFYNKAPRIGAFKGAHYTCEPVNSGQPAATRASLELGLLSHSTSRPAGVGLDTGMPA